MGEPDVRKEIVAALDQIEVLLAKIRDRLLTEGKPDAGG